jgi:hypothetical protein
MEEAPGHEDDMVGRTDGRTEDWGWVGLCDGEREGKGREGGVTSGC